MKFDGMIGKVKLIHMTADETKGGKYYVKENSDR